MTNSHGCRECEKKTAQITQLLAACKTAMTFFVSERDFPEIKTALENAIAAQEVTPGGNEDGEAH